MSSNYEKKIKVEIRVNDKHLTDMSSDRFMDQMHKQHGLTRTLEEYIEMFNEDPNSIELKSVARILE